MARFLSDRQTDKTDCLTPLCACGVIIVQYLMCCVWLLQAQFEFALRALVEETNAMMDAAHQRQLQ